MKGCELCSKPARIHCEADGASLCSNCDDKVHSANFIVAKHSRNLLCHCCQSPTPWKASGPKLGRTVSVCDTCVRNFCSQKQGRRGAERGGGRENDEFEVEDECSCDEEDGELNGSGEDEDEEGGDNQVVPWSCSTSNTPPPSPVASSSSSEAVSSAVGGGGGGGGGGVSALKRKRENADLDSEGEIGCISSQYNHDVSSTATSSQALDNREANSSGYFKSVKLPRRGEREV
ncbi:hypothetical protein Vadar_033512 [Vaccinium darrowii]|uniref:Uncharacterized protein n=1 Tax=Vaccinium darrowii TaxID=229202 RepID=A0ACB7Z7V5_9ERIC|nr:hypothetical protein Vadar_033512 [Vaccinium darrowii]